MTLLKKIVIAAVFVSALGGCNKEAPLAEAEKSVKHAESAVLTAAISPDGKFSIVSAEGRFQVSGEQTNYEIVRDDLEGVKVWNNETGELVHNFFHTEAPNQVKSVAISENNEYFATAEKGSVKLWDMETLETLGYWQFETPIRRLALSTTGRYLIVGTQHGQIAHIDTVTERQLIYLGHTYLEKRSQIESDLDLIPSGKINSLALTPSGRFVLSGSIDKTAKLWDGESGQTIQTFQHPTRVSTVAMDKNAQYAFTSDVVKNHQIWNARTGELFKELDITERFSWFSAATFSNDAKFLATGSPNQEVILWKVSSGEQIARWKTTPFSTVLDIKFVGDYLITENSKGVAEWWKLPPR